MADKKVLEKQTDQMQANGVQEESLANGKLDLPSANGKSDLAESANQKPVEPPDGGPWVRCLILGHFPVIYRAIYPEHVPLSQMIPALTY
jgi:hypothetical protein